MLAVAVVAGCALVGFVPAGALLSPAAVAAVVGLALSTAALAVVRPAGLFTEGWHYLRELA